MYLGDDSPTSIIRCCRVKIQLKNGRIRTLPGVLHIPNIARKLIYVGNMDVAGVKTVCGDGGCKMVWGSMVLMRGVRYGTLYKLLGKTIIDECNNSIVLEEGERYQNPNYSRRKDNAMASNVGAYRRKRTLSITR